MYLRDFKIFLDRLAKKAGSTTSFEVDDAENCELNSKEPPAVRVSPISVHF